MTPAELNRLFSSRSSIRSYSRKMIERALIEELLAAATLAPSGQNRQPWTFHVVTAEKQIRRLGSILREEVERIRPQVDPEHLPLFEKYIPFITHVEKAPVLIFVTARPYESFQRLLRDQGDQIPGTFTDHSHIQSVAAAVTHLLLAAEVRGLGACWNTNILLARTAIEAELGITAPWELTCLVTIGYPEVKDRPPVVKKRYPVRRVTVFHEEGSENRG